MSATHRCDGCERSILTAWSAAHDAWFCAECWRRNVDCPDGCRDAFRGIWRTLADETYGMLAVPHAGDEVNISTARPLFFDRRWPPACVECWHGVEFWFTPTNDQILRWREAETP